MRRRTILLALPLALAGCSTGANAVSQTNADSRYVAGDGKTIQYTPAERKARQRVRPPQILLTTPESLSLLLSHEDSLLLFQGLKTVVVDEIHAFATGKRGDLLSLALSRLEALAPGRPVPDASFWSSDAFEAMYACSACHVK